MISHHPLSRLLLLALLILGLPCVSGSAYGQSKEAFIPAIDYIELQGDNPQAPDIELFFWYGDSASYQVDLMLNEYLQLHPDLELKRTPVVARLSWRPQAYIDPLLAQLASQVETLPTRSDIYQACLNDCSQFKDFESIEKWLMQYVEPEALEHVALREIWQAEKNARQRAKKFAIWQVPTIIVKGRYLTNGKMAKSPMRLTRLLTYLLSKEEHPSPAEKP